MIHTKKKEFQNLSVEDFKEWEVILQECKDSTIFHTPEWIKIMVDEFSIQCIVLMAYNNDNLVGIFPYFSRNDKFFFKKLSTGIFETPYGGPLALEDNKKEILKILFSKFDKSILVIKSSIFLPPRYNIDFIRKSEFKIRINQAMIIDLDRSEEEIFANFKKSKRTSIRKAIRNNVEIEERGKEDINLFYMMLIDTYDRLNLSPPIKMEFYEKMFDVFEPYGQIKLTIAFYKGEAIASNISLLYKNSIYAWQGASYKEYDKFSPTDLSEWFLIRLGRHEGFKNYNLLHFHDKFGNEITSLKRYKLSFGARPVDYCVLSRKKNLLTQLFSKP